MVDREQRKVQHSRQVPQHEIVNKQKRTFTRIGRIRQLKEPGSFPSLAHFCEVGIAVRGIQKKSTKDVWPGESDRQEVGQECEEDSRQTQPHCKKNFLAGTHVDHCTLSFDLALSYGLPGAWNSIYNRLMSRASNLFRLQELDLALDQAHKRLVEIKKVLADDEELERAQEISDRRESELRSVRADNLSAEHAVESQRTKIKEVEEMLYSGAVTDPKELQDRQQEAESLKRHLSTLEDRLLEEMMTMEEAEQSYQQAQKKLQEIELSRSAQHQALFEEREKLRREVERLDGEREAALAGVSSKDLALYDDLRSRYGGRAVALVSDNACSACGMELARSVPQAASSGSELVRCPQCSRILYVG